MGDGQVRLDRILEQLGGAVLRAEHDRRAIKAAADRRLLPVRQVQEALVLVELVEDSFG